MNVFFLNFKKKNGAQALIDSTFSTDSRVLIKYEPWDLFSNKMISSVCHFCLSPRLNSHFFRVPFIFRSIWFKYIFNVDKQKDYCFCFNAHYYALAIDSLKYLRNKYNNCKIILLFSDKYSFFSERYKNFPSSELLKQYFDCVLTYNVKDSEKYGFQVYRPMIPVYPPTNENKIVCDVFFVGKNKNRLDTILDVYKKLSSYGLKCKFYVSDVDLKSVPFNNFDIHWNEYIEYDTVIDYVKRSKCVLNIVQKGATGITLRDMEAIGNNKILITDNYSIKETDFYSEKQVIWVSEIDEKIDLIKKGFVEKNEIVFKYGPSQWIDWLENLLTN